MSLRGPSKRCKPFRHTYAVVSRQRVQTYGQHGEPRRQLELLLMCDRCGKTKVKWPIGRYDYGRMRA